MGLGEADRPDGDDSSMDGRLLRIAAGWVLADMDDGDLVAACSRAARRVIREGMLKALWRDNGGSFLYGYVSAHLRNVRSARLGAQSSGIPAATVVLERPAAPRGASADAPMAARPAGDGGALFAPYRVDGGRWIDLGAMTRGQCLWVAAEREKLAIKNAREVLFLRRIAEGMQDGQTVREVYDSAAILRIRKELDAE